MKEIRVVNLLLAVCACYCLNAQTPGNSAYHSAIASATIKKIKKSHFGPRPFDDVYSAAVWNNFLHTLDPESYFFIQDDIKKLSVFKNKIDDELNSGSVAFFDSAYSIYHRRLEEAKELSAKILSAPFDLDKKETVVTWRKNLPFPATVRERNEIWQKLLKYYTLRHYMEKRKPGSDPAKTDMALEADAREIVRKWFSDYFRQALAKTANDEKFTQYMSVVVAEIDPHTAYVAPEDRSFTESINARYYGLGIELEKKESDFYVKKVVPGGSAYQSGEVKENDNIISIADNKGEMRIVSGMMPNEVSNMIRGDKGSMVKMTLQQPGENARTVTLRRDEVVDFNSRARSAIIEKDGRRFGYLYLPLFYMDPSGNNLNGAGNDVLREVEKLKQEEVDGIVMDIRGNGGGSLQEAVIMGAAFVPQGLMSLLKGKNGLEIYKSPDVKPVYDGPLTILVDESSASASEIFAAAMQDRGRALIVGTSSSFGKGTAQNTVVMGKVGDPGKGTADTSYGSMRLTVQKFYRITGASTQLRGVRPDVVLQDRMSLESIMERDFSSALPWDTVSPPEKVQRMPFSFNYHTVVNNANRRVQNNPSFKTIAANMQLLDKLRRQPAPLDLKSFSIVYRQMNNCKKAIDDARELKNSDTLKIEPSLYKNINPALQKDALTEKASGDWMKKLSKDFYLAETLSVLEDMIAGR